MESGVASGTSASFEFVEYLLPETLPLIVGMDTHTHDFGTRGRGATKSSHSNDMTLDAPFATLGKRGGSTPPDTGSRNRAQRARCGICWQFTSREARRKLERLYPVKETSLD
jgi:hypothetical protein